MFWGVYRLPGMAWNWLKCENPYKGDQGLFGTPVWVDNTIPQHQTSPTWSIYDYYKVPWSWVMEYPSFDSCKLSIKCDRFRKTFLSWLCQLFYPLLKGAGLRHEMDYQKEVQKMFFYNMMTLSLLLRGVISKIRA